MSQQEYTRTGAFAPPITSLGNTLRVELRFLSHQAEAESSGAVAGFTLVDRSGLFIQEGVFPSLPSVFENSLSELAISVPFIGTCAEAICNGQSVSCNNIGADTRFDPKWRELLLHCGVQSLRSKPIFGRRRPEGTFVIAFKEPVTDDHWDDALMANYADLAKDIIARHRE